MRELSDSTKRKIHENVRSFVDKVNGLVNKYYPSVRLAQVAYGSPYRDQYYYFDFPWSPNVEKLNQALAEGGSLHGVDKYIHLKYDEIDSGAYIEYEYDIDGIDGYKIYRISHNLNPDIRDEDLHRFLPIMHCAITMETTFDEDVDYIPNLKSGDHRIIVLSRILGQQQIGTDREKHVMVCTFTVDENDFQVTQETVDDLYADVMFFLESHFNSPVLDLLLEDHKKSEILRFEHDIGTIKIPGSLGRLKKAIQANDSSQIQIRFKWLEKRLTVLDEFLASLFASEYERVGENPRRKLIEEKKHLDTLIIWMCENMNLDRDVTTYVNQALDSEDRSSVYLGNFDTGLEKESREIQSLFWNLWQNAMLAAGGRNPAEVNVSLFAENGWHVVQIENIGILPVKYLKYLNDLNSSYPPNEHPRGTRYRGLQIARNIVVTCQHRRTLTADNIQDKYGNDIVRITLKLKLK